MTTALYIYYTPSWQPLADIVLPIAARYCERWGYAKEFVCEEQGSIHSQLTDGTCPLPIGYYKMLHLRTLLDKYDLIFVLDCDAMITNEGVRIEDYNLHSIHMLFTKDSNGLNAGSWIIRSNDFTKQFIDNVIANFDAPEEQTVIKQIFQKLNIELDNDTWFLPHPSINSYLYTEYLNDWAAKVGDVPMPTHEQGNWQPGDFILHLPGLTLERRIEIFNMIKEQV